MRSHLLAALFFWLMWWRGGCCPTDRPVVRWSTKEVRSTTLLVDGTADALAAKVRCFLQPLLEARDDLRSASTTDLCDMLNTIDDDLIVIVAQYRHPCHISLNSRTRMVLQLFVQDGAQVVAVFTGNQTSFKVTTSIPSDENLHGLLETACAHLVVSRRGSGGRYKVLAGPGGGKSHDANEQKNGDHESSAPVWVVVLMGAVGVVAFVGAVLFMVGRNALQRKRQSEEQRAKRPALEPGEASSSKNSSNRSKSSSKSFEERTPLLSSRRELSTPVTAAQFKHYLTSVGDYAVKYLDTIESRLVFPDVEPGYLRSRLPPDAPHNSEPFASILQDIENHIMPGVTHWQHPQFHGYFPAGNSYASLLGDLFASAMGCHGFSWKASPVNTELEMLVVDWVGRMIGLPEQFLFTGKNSVGGGAIQVSASECILVAVLAARHCKMRQLLDGGDKANMREKEIRVLEKLVAYCSDEAHSSIEKACKIAMVKLRPIRSDEKYSLRGAALEKAIEKDVQRGLIPFFVFATLGSTSVCSFDRLDEIGPVVIEFDAWLHVDAAYAGCALVCPEMRDISEGIEGAMSVNMNAHKWMLTIMDCSLMWTRDRVKLTAALTVDPLYLHNDTVIDYRHWGIAVTRRFRALKLWFVLRLYGVAGIQNYIRRHIRLALRFSALAQADERIEMVGEQKLGLVCFRLKDGEVQTRQLLTALNATREILLTPASPHGQFVIRVCINHEHATEADIDKSWSIIQTGIDNFYHESRNVGEQRPASLLAWGCTTHVQGSPPISTCSTNSTPPPSTQQTQDITTEVSSDSINTDIFNESGPIEPVESLTSLGDPTLPSVTCSPPARSTSWSSSSSSSSSPTGSSNSSRGSSGSSTSSSDETTIVVNPRSAA